MAGSIVQIVGPGGAGSAATTVVSLSITVTAGNKLWVIASSDDTSITACSDSISGSNVYTLQGSVLGSGISNRLYHLTCPIAVSGTGTVTVTFNASVANRQIWLVELTGVPGVILNQGTATDAGNNPTTAASASNAVQPFFAIAANVDYQLGTPVVRNINGAAATSGGALSAGGQFAGVVEYAAGLTTVGTNTADFTNSSFNRTCTVFLLVSELLVPTITAQPTDQTAFDGASATFSVSATISAGGGSLSYQWQDNSSGSFANIGGATSQSLTVLASLAMNGRRYRCNVTDSNGTTPTNSATLFVRTITAARPPQQIPLLPPFKRAKSALWLLDVGNWGNTPLNVAKWFASELNTATGGGGTTYNDSVAETLAGVDTITATAAFAAVIAETGAAADAITASALFAATVAETAAAVDTVTAAAVTAAAVAETGNAADTVSAVATLNGVIAETLAAVDSPSALLVFIAQVNEVLSGADTVTASALFSAAIAETLAAVDTVTVSANFNATISETLNAVDTTDATITGAGGTTYNDSVSETLNAVDTVSASANFAGAISETLSAADSSDALLTQLGVIAETLAATETVNGLISATAAISETGAAADTVTSLLVTTASVQEVANAIETITTQTNFNATIVEVMNAFDSTDATGGTAPTTTGHAYWLIFKRRTRR